MTSDVKTSQHFVALLKMVFISIYILAGLALFILTLPLLMSVDWNSLLSLDWYLRLDTVFFLIFSAIILGVASIPGCVQAAIRWFRGEKSNRWIRISLWSGLITSAVGLSGGTLMGYFYPFSTIVIIGSAVLLYDLDEIRSRPPNSRHRWFAQLFGMTVMVSGFMIWMLQGGLN